MAEVAAVHVLRCPVKLSDGSSDRAREARADDQRQKLDNGQHNGDPE